MESKVFDGSGCAHSYIGGKRVSNGWERRSFPGVADVSQACDEPSTPQTWRRKRTWAITERMKRDIYEMILEKKVMIEGANEEQGYRNR